MKMNKKLQDNMNIQKLIQCIDIYSNTIKMEKEMNTTLNHRKIRLSNFPSHISENIVKFVFYNTYRIMPSWDTKKGDLFIPLLNIQIEVKGSIDLSNAPPTFGPKENWDFIYFVDGINNHNKIYKVYEIKLSNHSELWKTLPVNKTQTFYDHCHQKRRPRVLFKEIQAHFGEHCKMIYHGCIADLMDS